MNIVCRLVEFNYINSPDLASTGWLKRFQRNEGICKFMIKVNNRWLYKYFMWVILTNYSFLQRAWYFCTNYAFYCIVRGRGGLVENLCCVWLLVDASLRAAMIPPSPHKRSPRDDGICLHHRWRRCLRVTCQGLVHGCPGYCQVPRHGPLSFRSTLRSGRHAWRSPRGGLAANQV